MTEPKPVYTTDTDMGVTCPACGTEITIANAGGYRTYCEGCCISGDDWTIISDNCLTVMGNMADDSIDLTVTSPWYDNLREYGESFDVEKADWHPIIKDLYRVTAVGGVVVWVVADATIDGSETGTSFKQALWAMECGFRLHDTMIYQQAGTGAKGSNYAYWQSFEYMFVFSKGKPKTVNRITYPHKNANKPRGFSPKSARNGSRVDRVEYKNPETSVKPNVWRYALGTDDTGNHSAPFPEALANDHIISWSNPGDMVFDPFLGSGTTGKMAIRNGRKFIGCDIEPSYVDIAHQRIANAAGDYVTTETEKKNGQVAIWDMFAPG